MTRETDHKLATHTTVYKLAAVGGRPVILVGTAITAPGGEELVLYPTPEKTPYTGCRWQVTGLVGEWHPDPASALAPARAEADARYAAALKELDRLLEAVAPPPETHEGTDP